MQTIAIFILAFITIPAFADIRDESHKIDKILLTKDIVIPADTEFVKISEACSIETPKVKSDRTLKAGSHLKVYDAFNLIIAGSTRVLIKNSTAVIGLRCNDWSESLNELETKIGDAGKLVLKQQ